MYYSPWNRITDILFLQGFKAHCGEILNNTIPRNYSPDYRENAENESPFCGESFNDEVYVPTEFLK